MTTSNIAPIARRFAAVMALALASAAATSAAEVRVTVTNELPDGGFFFTPMWLGLHDGTFDTYNGGELLDPDFAFLEPLAELGDTGPISDAFAMSNPGGLQTTLLSPSGAPPFAPGQSAFFDFDVTDATAQRYLSYASMIVPSNDLFISNASPVAHEVFDASGGFNGPFTILVFGSEIDDAGTEVNDPFDGGAFVDGVDGTLGTTESVVVTDFVLLPGADADLAELIGLTTPTGDVITGPDSLAALSESLVASITISAVPEPSSVALAAFGALGVGLIARRSARRRAA